MIRSSFCWWIIQHPEILDEMPIPWGYPKCISARVASSNRTCLVLQLSEDIFSITITLNIIQVFYILTKILWIKKVFLNSLLENVFVKIKYLESNYNSQDEEFVWLKDKIQQIDQLVE